MWCWMAVEGSYVHRTQNGEDDATGDSRGSSSPVRRIALDQHAEISGMERVFLVLSYVFVVIFFPISLFFVYRVAYQYERVVILRLGKLRRGERGPGLYFILPCIDEDIKVDMWTVLFDVHPQHVLTKDSCTVIIDVVIFCRVTNPVRAIVAVTDVSDATFNLASTTIRNIIGQQLLAEFLSEKDKFSEALKQIIDEGTNPWGIEVLRVEIMGISLPVHLQRSMASEAEATREARAKLVAAEGEFLASKALTEASVVMIENPLSIHLRYLQSLMTVSSDQNHSIIFPLATDIFRSFLPSKIFALQGPSTSKAPSIE